MDSYELTVHSAAPPEIVFAVLADATRWHEWAGFSVATSQWEREGDPAPGGVRMTDHVTYDIGWGPVGGVAGKLWVHRQLKHIFDYRAQRVHALFPRAVGRLLRECFLSCVVRFANSRLFMSTASIHSPL